MKPIYLFIAILVSCIVSSAAAPKKILLIAGPLDDHAPGTHEYENNVLLLKHCLENSAQRNEVTVEAHFGGWPKDPATLDTADTIVLTSGGCDRKETDHPLYVGDRFSQLEKQMNRGCGLMMFHWSVFHPHRNHDKITEWLGGYFDYETGKGGPTNTWFSQIQHETWSVLPNLQHPVARGLQPFMLQEEFYFNMRFRENDRRLKPVLFKQTSDKTENVIAWAVERENGGRGFGFTGGHFYTNWWVPEFRKVVLNGIIWTAGLDVPSGGVESSLEKLVSPPSAKLKPGAAPAVSQPAVKKIKPSTAAKDSGAVAKEEDWKDGRWNQMDNGSFMSASLQAANGAKGLSIRVGPQGDAGVSYETASADFRAAWEGGFLQYDSVRFGLLTTPLRHGEVRFMPPSKVGWNDSPVTYRGLHVNGARVVLSYNVGQTAVLETPWLESNGDTRAFVRTFHVAATETGHRLAIVYAKDAQLAFHNTDRVRSVRFEANGQATALAMTGATATFSLTNDLIELQLPPSKTARMFKLWMWTGAPAATNAFSALAHKNLSVENVRELARPGAPRWGKAIVTKGELAAPSNEPYVVDTISVPYDNPYKALMFLSGVDFFSNGDAAVCTIHGDVWLVRGIDDKLREIQWRRFATGLFQPLGLKIAGDKVHVLGRDQITILHDQNGDGEADFYENFCNKISTSPHGHDYATSLERDVAGNFYYVCPAGVHRVSKDGKQHETLATGFRNPNGMGVGPDGVITVAPQEGNWTPASAIFEIKRGGFYGYGGPQISSERPLGYDAPLCWIPRMIDNSTGSQVWVMGKKWGPLEGQMLSLSFGRCSMMLVLREVVDGQAQGGVVPLKPRFLSGAMRGTFRPHDGQLYVVGSHGWSTSASRDGCFQRVRYTGKKLYVPTALNVRSNGLQLAFTEPLERETAEDPGSYGVEHWNYRYAQEYGSKEYSVSSPSQEGHDELEIKSARLSQDGRSVFLEVVGLQPVMQMQVQYNLNAADGKSVRGEIYNTINRLGAAQ